MSTFRMVHTDFWRDPVVVEEFTPEDKLFFLYLLTNPATTQIGIYRITRKQMAYELGYSPETINSLLRRFIEQHKMIEYNEANRELLIIKWGKNSYKKGGKPVIDLVTKELAEVKTIEFIPKAARYIPVEGVRQAFETYYNRVKPHSEANLDESCHESLDESYPKKKKKEEEKEVEEEQERVSSLIKFMEQNGYGLVTPYVIEELQYLVTDYEPALIEQAIKIGIENNVRKLNYVKKVLSNWETEGITSLAAYQAKKQVKPQEANNFLSFVNGG